MELNKYQEQAMTTCMPTSNNFSYMMLNLVGEVGEFASKVAKAIRKDQITEEVSHLPRVFVPDFNIDPEGHVLTLSSIKGTDFELELQKEAGDILWQLAGLCSVMGWSLEDIAQQNLDKLASRQQRGKIDGDGDNR